MISLSKIIENRKLVLGRNERYLNYIRPYNKRGAIKIADDKTISKRILARAVIPVPTLVKVIKNRNQLNEFDFSTLPKSFVIKPVKGVRGGGVTIVYNRNKEGKWIASGNRRYTEDDLKSLIQDILDGRYSLFNEPDRALIEERVRPHKGFKYYSYKGAPDIRVLIFNSIPVMSYIRLPTKESDGKANLDLGAIAAGIDMAVGKTTSSIIGKSTAIEYVPNTNLPLSGIKIPYWDKILRYACEASKVTGLGFGAVDFLIDEEKGPVIVEMNARPGLSIQLANDDGLRWRLKKASGIKVKTTERAVRLAKDLFGGEIEEEIESLSGKQVIGLTTNIEVYSLDLQTSFNIKAKVDTGADLSSIDESLAVSLGFGDIIEEFKTLYSEASSKLTTEDEAQVVAQDIFTKLKLKFDYLTNIKYIRSSHGTSLRLYVNIKIIIEGQEIITNFTIFDRKHLSYKILLGNNTLGKFLIDPSKIQV